jgi:hypothetical protein
VEKVVTTPHLYFSQNSRRTRRTEIMYAVSSGVLVDRKRSKQWTNSTMCGTAKHQLTIYTNIPPCFQPSTQDLCWAYANTHLFCPHRDNLW